jgi:histidinol-phosphatase (PHP family)
MAIETDFHSHLSFTSANAMVLAAREKGLRILGLSEHVFQMTEVRPTLEHMPIEGATLSFRSYHEQIRAAADQTCFDVRIGMEVDYIPDKNAVIQPFLINQQWDFLIGSVHEVDGVLIEDHYRLNREEGENFWSRYLGLLRDAVRSGYFNLVSHPVRMKARNPHLPATFDDQLEMLAAEATRFDVALEINGYGVLHYPDTVRRLIKACVLHHTPISVGSDAHYPRQIAQAHQQTEALLHEAGLSKIRIWKQQVPEEYSF